MSAVTSSFELQRLLSLSHVDGNICDGRNYGWKIWSLQIYEDYYVGKLRT